MSGGLNTSFIDEGELKLFEEGQESSPLLDASDPGSFSYETQGAALSAGSYQIEGSFSSYSSTSSLTPGSQSGGYNLSVEAEANQSPVADADVPDELVYGETLTLDGSDSFDPNDADSIAEYAWDLNGDGSFGFSSSEPVLSLDSSEYESSIPSVGSYAPSLRVTDLNGATGFDTTEMVVIPIPAAGLAGLAMAGLLGFVRPGRRRERA